VRGRVTDVSDESQVEGAMLAAHDAFRSLYIVVDCACFGRIAPLTEQVEITASLTLGGAFYGAERAARGRYSSRGSAVVINISSVNAASKRSAGAAYE
jgi:NAD(P)-dependent dehydrogenase (short-subunit alcohol dehydrogenase family)